MIQRIIPNPYKSLYRSLIFSAFILNIPALISMSGGNNLITTYIGLTQLVLFFLGVIFLMAGKRDVRGIQRLLAGELLAHWTYEKFHWESYTAAEYQRLRQNAVTTMIVFLLAGPILSLSGISEMTMTEGMIIGSMLATISLGIGFIYARSVLNNSKLPPFEAFIAKTGAFINGVFIDWSSSGVTLLNASIVNDPNGSGQHLLLSYSVRGKYSAQQKEMIVPIPETLRKEAHSVVKKLNQLRQR